jgi:hypothetical protein
LDKIPFACNSAALRWLPESGSVAGNSGADYQFGFSLYPDIFPEIDPVQGINRRLRVN